MADYTPGKRPRDAKVLQTQEKDRAKCVEFVRRNPGLATTYIPRQFRLHLKFLTERGLLEYRAGTGWFAT